MIDQKYKYRADSLTVGMVRMILFFRKYPWMALRMLGNRNGKPIDLANFQKIVVIASWKKLFPVFNLTRGGGKTFLQGNLAILSSLLYPRRQIGILSRTFRQAKMAFTEAEKTIKSSPLLQQCISKGPTWKTDECYVHWRHQGMMSALPLGDGGKIRGARFHTVYIDEYAQVPKDIIDVVIIGFTATVADPMLEVRRREKEKELIAKGIEIREKGVKKNQVCCFSTAYYQYNHLWETVQQRTSYIRSRYTNKPSKGNENYSILKIPYQALPDGFQSEDSIEMAKQTMSRYEFRMEYENYYPADSDGFFTMSILDSAVSKSCAYRYSSDGSHEYFLSIDPARDNDNCALVVIQVGSNGEPSVIVSIETLHSKSYTIIHDKILEILDRYDISRISIDKGGGGSEIKDKLCDPDKMKGRKLIWDIDDDISYINGVKTNPRPGRHILSLFKSSPNLLSDANHGLLSKFEKRSLVFAQEPNKDLREASSEIECAWYDIQSDEFEAAKKEMSSIVVTVTSRGVPHWDTENKHHRKDRYSAILVGANILQVIKEETIEKKDKELVEGGWMDQMSRGDERNSFFDDASL